MKVTSTDAHYQQPIYKATATQSYDECQYMSEWNMFRILDSLHHTATGLDNLPAWFLRLGAPVFCSPLTRLLNLSLATSVVPIQWKSAVICPAPKVAAPHCHADFRPISVTPVLTRIMEKSIVRHFMYPAFQQTTIAPSLDDQFAFRPTGSTTAAVISLLHTVTQMLSINPYVSVIAMDFSKAFDTVRHVTLMEKIAMLDLPDHVYNWLVNFFTGRLQCTTYGGDTSALATISASIVQGSAIGPASYVVNASDLKSVSMGNVLLKYADDTYAIIPSVNVETRTRELDNVELWAQKNNLTLNRSKCVEIIIHDRRRKRQLVMPATLPNIPRVQSLKVLGVTISNCLSVAEPVNRVISSSAQSVHALRLLRSHGMTN